MDVDQLVEIFAPLGEWETWNRDQKRQVLATLAPEIRVANYNVECLGLNPALFSNSDTRMGIPALPFCHSEIRVAKPKSERYPKDLKGLGVVGFMFLMVVRCPWLVKLRKQECWLGQPANHDPI